MSVRYLIDTDWAIHYLNGTPSIVERLNQLSDQGLGLSLLSLAELYEGVFYSTNPERNDRHLHDFLRGLTLIGIDEETCRIFGRERGRLRKTGKTIGDMDILIGATAVQFNLTLLTNNRRHFEAIERLPIESLPTKP
ncbi:MAG: type II toxin-antitoxin system VapC family toxin [Acidobacteria bacterium]|nr:type II toxin-antitoxin system VapC family toxin [Acidobacteriota bacterium]